MLIKPKCTKWKMTMINKIMAWMCVQWRKREKKKNREKRWNQMNSYLKIKIVRLYWERTHKDCSARGVCEWMYVDICILCGVWFNMLLSPNTMNDSKRRSDMKIKTVDEGAGETNNNKKHGKKNTNIYLFFVPLYTKYQYRTTKYDVHKQKHSLLTQT